MKRRLLASILSLVMVLSLLPVAAIANDEGDAGEPDAYTTGSDDPEGSGSGEDTPAYTLSGDCGADGGNVTWALTANSDGTYTMTIDGEGAMADYNYNVTKVDQSGNLMSNHPWRADKTGVAIDAITEVVVKNGVTSIGKQAFDGFSAVKLYDIAASVETIAAWGLCARNTVTFELNGNTNYTVENGTGVMMSADGSVLVAYPGGAEPVDEYDVPNTVETISAGAFVGCDAKKIVIPETVTSFPQWSFDGATTEELEFNASVTTIKGGTFSGMSSLKSLVFGSTTLDKIEEQSCIDLSSLTEITFPDSLTTIGAQAFKVLSTDGAAEPNLKKVTFGKHMSVIEDQVFLCQSALEAIDMTRCEKLTNVGNFSGKGYGGNDIIYTNTPVVYTANEDDAKLAKKTNDNRVIYAVTNGGTFSDNTTFTADTLAEPSKPNYKFDGWYEDAGFNTPVTTVTAGQIYYAKWAKKTIISNDCSATAQDHVRWGLDENSDGTYTLTISGKGNMADYTQPNKPNAANASVAPWYTALDEYANAENNFTVPITKIEVEDGVTGLGNWAFAYTRVTEATFTSSVKNYGVRVYANCPELTTVNWDGFAPEKALLTIDDSEPYDGCAIPGNLFDTDRKLHISIVDGVEYTDTLVIPDTVKAVGNGALYATAFTEIDFATGLKGVEQVGYYTFAYMPNLVKLSVPAGLTYKNGAKVESSAAFAEEKNENFKLTLADGITEIANSEFASSSGLTTLTLPSAVMRIGRNAFYGTNRLYAVDMTKVSDKVTLDEFAFKTVSNSNVLCTFYTGTSTLAEKVKANNENNTTGNVRGKYAIYAVTDGGTFKAGTAFEEGKLATPEKEGYKFIGWYTKDGSSTDDWGEQVTADTTLEAGRTYYAKYGESAVLDTTLSTAVVGEQTEFTISSMANADKDTMVRSYFTLVDANGSDAKSAIDTLDYLETSVSPNAWVDLKQFNFEFGPVAGYPLTDNAKSHFRVTFNKAGAYTLTVSCKAVADDSVVCSKTVTITVDPKSIAAPEADGTQFVYTGSAQTYSIAENAAYTVTGNVQTDAGTYTVTVSLKDKANTVWADDDKTTADKEYTFTIAKADGSVTAPTAIENLVYNGSEQALVNAGSSDTGTIQYKLDNGEYSENVPTATNAGTYTISYKVVGDKNHENVAEASIKVTIAKAKYDMTGVEFDNASYTYDGNAKTLLISGTLPAGVSVTYQDNTLTNVGETTATAHFTGDAANYEAISDMQATLTITKADQTKPAAPTLKDRSYTSITLYEVEGAEYSKDGGTTWQSSPEFKGLTSGTTYEFVIRYAETKNYNASDASDAAKFTTRRYSSAAVTPTPTPEPEPTPDDSSKFVDVPANAYFADAVKWAVENGVTNGLSDTMFGPYESCTRAQIVTFLWRAAGSPEPKAMSSFTDVSASAYYAKAVAWAVENGITNGMTETTFAPDATCTRGQSVTFLYRALKGTASGSANFADVKSDAFYADAVNWAVANNVTNGTSATTFSPNADCTRAEIVTFLYRAYQGK